MVEVAFWFSLLFIGYAYLGYPFILWLISLFHVRPIQKAMMIPPVSFIITAYNEEARIQDKLENTLRQDYPREQLEIIVASDGSTDTTDDIVNTYHDRGIQLVRALERKGKENAQRYAVEHSSGEILVFSDVATVLSPHAVSTIVMNFHDASVGCVSSVDKFIEAEGMPSGEGAYVRYEMLLRHLETRVNTVVGLSGSFFAARREVCQNWAIDLQSDFNTLLNTVKAGMRGVSDPDSIGYYKTLADDRDEFNRKVRTVVRGIAVLMKSRAVLNPFRYGLFAWQLFSHKLCRWLVPFAMVLALFSNIYILSHSPFYAAMLAVQVGVYTLAVMGFWIPWVAKSTILKLPSFLVLTNLSILKAWMQYLRGGQVLTWEPSKREAL